MPPSTPASSVALLTPRLPAWNLMTNGTHPPAQPSSRAPMSKPSEGWRPPSHASASNSANLAPVTDAMMEMRWRRDSHGGSVLLCLRDPGAGAYSSAGADALNATKKTGPAIRDCKAAMTEIMAAGSDTPQTNNKCWRAYRVRVCAQFAAC